MRKLLSLTLLLFLLAFSAHAQQVNSFFDEADALFGKYVENGRVNYAAVARGSEMDRVIELLASSDVSGQDAATQKAFYINAYNLLVIHAVAERLPVESVLKVEGFFNRLQYRVAGEMLTLDQIEKEKLLKTYGDPRFHFVVVCGAVDCPPITNFAYRPENLEAQLRQQTRRALNDANFIQVNRSTHQVQLSQIFEWYASDFGGSKASALAFINRYRENPIPADYSIDFYRYDWSLNGR